MFCKQCILKKVAKFLGKQAPMLQSLFNGVAGPEACGFIKERLQYRCFPVNFAKFLRTRFFTEQLQWLLLIILNYTIYGIKLKMHILCQGELPQLYTNLANLYFPMNLTNFVPKSPCRVVKFSF